MAQGKPGRPEKYPWDIWFDGQDKLLRPGFRHFEWGPQHFDRTTSIASMMVAIRSKARQRGVPVRVRRYGSDGIELRFGDTGQATTKYDWDRIFDGQLHVLVEGEDFSCNPESMRQIAYAAARRADVPISVKTRAGESGKTQVAIQRMPGGRNWRDAAPTDAELEAMNAADAASSTERRDDVASRPAQQIEKTAPATAALPAIPEAAVSPVRPVAATLPPFGIPHDPPEES